jgi:phage terminase large subunit-like protein
VPPRRHLRIVDDDEKRGAGRPSKTLEQHVADGTFRKRIHEQLLDDEPLVSDPDLKKLQQRYRRLKTDSKRSEVGLEFERAARAKAPERQAADSDEIAERIRRLGPPRSAKRTIAFFEEFYVWDDGSPWRLDPWQKDWIRDWKRRDAVDRLVYREGLLGICRGQGKTPIASGLNTEEIATAETRSYAFQVAGSKLQASLGTEYASNWVDDGDLGKILRARKNSVVRRDGRGSYTVLSSDGRLAHGRRGRIKAIADELWLFKSYAEEQSYIALESALHKDPESQLLGISTAGYNLRSLLGRKYRRGLACPQIVTKRKGFLTIGRDPDAGFLMWWFGMPQGYELDLENDAAVMEALKLANPGSWTDHREQLRSLRRAMNGQLEEGDEIQDELEWLRLCLNFWTPVRGLWLKAGAWRQLAHPEVVIPPHADVYVAVDAAHSYDTTAVTWSWLNPDGKVVQRCKIFSVRAGAPAHVHVDDFYGADGVHIAERFINEELAGQFRVREVVGDPNYFGAELARLGKRFLTAPVFPTSKEMREYVQRFYRDVHARQIITDGDGIVTEHVEAIAGEKTSDGYWAIRKLHQSQPMDGGTSSIISNGRARRLEAAAKPWAARW